MFDIASSKLLILGLVALMVIGPKDLPALLRTIGKYMGMIKRQASDFRAQFEEAMRESELAEIKKQVETVGQQTESTLREAESTIEKQLAETRTGVDPQSVLGDPFAADTPAVTSPSPATPATDAPASTPEIAPPATTPDTARAPEKTGA